MEIPVIPCEGAANSLFRSAREFAVAGWNCERNGSYRRQNGTAFESIPDIFPVGRECGIRAASFSCILICPSHRYAVSAERNPRFFDGKINVLHAPPGSGFTSRCRAIRLRPAPLAFWRSKAKEA
jgi:hypothetical protein